MLFLPLFHYRRRLFFSFPSFMLLLFRHYVIFICALFSLYLPPLRAPLPLLLRDRESAASAFHYFHASPLPHQMRGKIIKNRFSIFFFFATLQDLASLPIEWGWERFSADIIMPSQGFLFVFACHVFFSFRCFLFLFLLLFLHPYSSSLSFFAIFLATRSRDVAIYFPSVTIIFVFCREE